MSRKLGKSGSHLRIRKFEMSVLNIADEKLSTLRALLSQLESVVVAYSGGVDSAFLLRVAHDELGDDCRAFTARSPSLMEVELEQATALARKLGVTHEIVNTNELGRSGYVENATDRCYFCKSELFDATSIAAEKFGDAVVIDGFNADDLMDHRPGHRAAKEHGVLHPLAEVGLTKEEIRFLSKKLSLPTWSKPQLACLASRIPYGTKVTADRLAKIEKMETALRNLDFHDLRARLVPENEDMVRIELGEDELSKAVQPAVRAEILRVAHSCGFKYVTIDLEGFRSGRMNEGLIKIGRFSTEAKL